MERDGCILNSVNYHQVIMGVQPYCQGRIYVWAPNTLYSMSFLSKTKDRNIDEIVKSQKSDGFEKSPQARRANPEE
jgi:hypothetical protein